MPNVKHVDNDETGHDLEKKRIAPNAVFAVLQVLVSSAILFLLYRFLLTSLGVEALGVWSLVVAATSLANISNLGLAGGTVRFVSRYLAQGDDRNASLVVETATLTIAAVMGLVMLLLWLAVDWLLGLVIPAAWIDEARQIVPFTLAALWFSSVGGAIHSALDGCHRADLRSIAMMLTQPLLLLMAIWLVPQMGLMGIAYAQMFQYVVWLGLGWLLLRKQLPMLSKMPKRWSRHLFLEMWRYGLSFQLITIFVLLTEPLAKGLLSYYGNLTAVGYFEMANRLVGQVRAILVSANQVLVPYYSMVGETSRESVKTVYMQNLNTIILLGSLVFSTLVAMLPLISELWIGQLETQFLLFAGMLTGGWFVNTLSSPAYFANLGLGNLLPNLKGHATSVISMAPLAILGAFISGTVGCASAWPISLILGACYIVISFHRAESIPMSVLFNLENLKVLSLGCIMAFSGFVTYSSVNNLAGIFGTVISTAIIVLVGWVIFFVMAPIKTHALGVVRSKIMKNYIK